MLSFSTTSAPPREPFWGRFTESKDDSGITCRDREPVSQGTLTLALSHRMLELFHNFLAGHRDSSGSTMNSCGLLDGI